MYTYTQVKKYLDYKRALGAATFLLFFWNDFPVVFSFIATMLCVVFLQKKKKLNVFQKRWKKKKNSEADFFYSMHSTWKCSRTLIWSERCLFQKKKPVDGESMRLPPEDTASTILFIKTLWLWWWERKKSIPYWSFGCLQKNTWTFLGVRFPFLEGGSLDSETFGEEVLQ